MKNDGGEEKKIVENYKNTRLRTGMKLQNYFKIRKKADR